MADEELETLRKRLKIIETLIHCPGALRCARCGWDIMSISVTPEGPVTKPMDCQKCGHPMWPMTEREVRQQAQLEYVKLCNEMEAQYKEATEALKSAVESLRKADATISELQKRNAELHEQLEFHRDVVRESDFIGR